MSDSASPAEQIRIIRRMIETSRRNTTGFRTPLLLFGGLGISASLASHALLVRGDVQAIGWVWGAFFVLGAAASLYRVRRRARLQRVVSFVDQVTGVLWLAVGISIVLVAVSHAGSHAPRDFIAHIAWFLALGLCVSAKLLEWPPLYAAAGLWWAGGIAIWIWPADAFLIEAALLALGYLAPAWWLGGREATGRHAGLPSSRVDQA